MFHARLCKRLPVSGAFHSEFMRPAMEPLGKVVSSSCLLVFLSSCLLVFFSSSLLLFSSLLFSSSLFLSFFYFFFLFLHFVSVSGAFHSSHAACDGVSRKGILFSSSILLPSFLRHCWCINGSSAFHSEFMWPAMKFPLSHLLSPFFTCIALCARLCVVGTFHFEFMRLPRKGISFFFVLVCT